MTTDWPADIAIGDAVLDADGVPWRVLNRPLGAPCDGLFRALDDSGRQRYGEHMRFPVVVLDFPLPLRLADDVWCLTCNHEHIAYIPSTTFLCADCSFGSWEEAVAEHHAAELPSHVVYPVVHEVTAQ